MEMKRTVRSLTEPYFFDTDCLSAFLWVGNESLLEKLYHGRIIIPRQVYDELSNPTVAHLKNRIDSLINDGSARIEVINTDTDTYDLYRKLTSRPDPGHKAIGRGEASAIVLAKRDKGILASNNLRDIQSYVDEFSLKHMTTGDILKVALEKGFITEQQGNVIWGNMLRKRRKLGYNSFSDFLVANP